VAQELGADQLPSYSQRPVRGGKGIGHGFGRGPVDAANITQAQASRLLAATYNRLVGVGAVVAGTADAGIWLTDAQAAYRAAYDAYQAGNYADAAASAKVANALAEVATGVQRATTSPGTSGAPVTVPAPNFP
jgi:TolA-binding protein